MHGNIKRQLMSLIQTGRLIIIILMFILNFGCSISEKSDKKLNGLSIESVTKEIGKPDSTIEFILSNKIKEYQYGLLTYYPEPEGKDILIKEYIWEHKHEKRVVWFHKVNGKWVSIDNLTWNPDKIKY